MMRDACLSSPMKEQYGKNPKFIHSIIIWRIVVTNVDPLGSLLHQIHKKIMGDLESPQRCLINRLLRFT